MPRKHADDEHGLPPSKSQRKREHRALQELAEALAALPESHFRRLALAGRTREELVTARAMEASGARNRQIRRIAQLLEGEDTAALLRPVDELAARQRAEAALHHRAEQLRELVLAQGAPALGLALGAADSARLAALRAEALSAHDAARARHARREIYRLALALLQQAQPGT